MTIRPAVLKFAEAMEAVLQENDYKGDPSQLRLDEALDGIWRELRELDRVAYGQTTTGTSNYERQRIRKEAVDVANFALMAWFGADR